MSIFNVHILYHFPVHKQFELLETDLSIIVTPRLVRPSRPGDVVATPLDNSLPSNDIDLFLMGKVETPRVTARLLEDVQMREFAGHVLDLPKGGVNASTVSIRN